MHLSPEDVIWAKKSDKTAVFQWLPLKQHLVDVTEVIKLLWEHWLSGQQKQHIINSLSQPNEVLAKNLAGFLAASHDLGKATPVFQSRPSFYQSPDLDRALMEKLETVGFAGIAECYSGLMNPGQTHHAVAGQVLLEYFGVSHDISSIIGAHHGTPVDSGEETSLHLSAYPNNYFQDEGSAVHHMWAEVQRTIFDWALEMNDFESVKELPSITQPGQVLLSGLLIMADWIASNENYFPLIPVDETSVDDMDTRKETGWLKWYRTSPRIEEEHTDIFLGYNQRFGFESGPRDFQLRLFEIIEETIHPGIFIVEAPMGVGKTEAALIGVEQLSAKTRASGMFFGLPTQATSDGIFGRIKDWLEHLDDETKSLRLVHGKAALNDIYSALPQADISGEPDKSVVVNEWFAGRKTAVLDDFVVGTVDQFLMTALKQKHLALKHLGFSKKVIVIDEVHAYDAYMNQYLYTALRWMGAYNVPVIVLSATLPAKTRIELVENYMRGGGNKWRDVVKPEGWETSQAYPLITYTDGTAIKQFSDMQVASHSVADIIRLEEKDLISTLDQQLADGGIAGVIVNTVRRAQEIASTCGSHFGEDAVDLLHSNFIATDRIEKEKELLEIIGKKAKRPPKKIIVGTQVIEQSLDIDFDLLVTDLAPMDLLIQRIGRLHRHSPVERPEKLRKPKTFVMGAGDKDFNFEPGSRAVYGDYLLMRTQLLLPHKIHLPEDISPLVQAVYGDDHNFIEKKMQDKYRSIRKEQESEIARKKRKAAAYLLDNPSFRRDKSLIGWLAAKLDFSSDERAIAQVRDTQETIEVIALKEYETGYTFFHQECDLSQEIHDPSVQRDISRHTIRLPLQLSAPYNIEQTITELEKFNLKYLPFWQESSWLRGMLGVIFNEKDEFIINGFKLKYCRKLGLSCEKLT
ncbi:MAG: CRISPR-associated helicase Cas3' [Firmicutes bacterium]|nr:CRISPR-associated helicase Cas3' [Bacillota bacterium]